MSTSTPPPIPHEKLFLECKRLAGSSVWAIGMGTNENGEFTWQVYCSNKKEIKKIPKKFNGHLVEAVYCEKPTFG